MRIVLLGTGTSAGVPTLGCRCDVCRSTDPHNKRMRCSAYIEHEGARFLIDCGPDFRTQALANGVEDVDFVLLTHAHADHVGGLDDLRAYNMIHKHPIAVYGTEPTLTSVRTRYSYCFETPTQVGGGIPNLNLVTVALDRELVVGGVRAQPLTIFHGSLPIIGYRIGSFAYLTDVSAIPEDSFSHLEGVEVLVTSTLRHRPHSTHMSLDESVAAAKRIGAKQTWFIHMCHDLDHQKTNAELPPNIQLAHDGLELLIDQY